MERDKAYLVLADGHVFAGEAAGARGAVALGELVFATGMGGYIETLTDPSYYGQIVMQTFPLIGNYGFIPQDAESDRCVVRGYVARELCDMPSNFRCAEPLEDFLRARGIVGITGVDTRAVTLILREAGVMNAMIVPDPAAVDWDALRGYRVERAVASVSANRVETWPAQGLPAAEGQTLDRPLRVTLIDYGAKHNIEHELAARGCTVTVVPADTTAEAILAEKPDGVMLSNGPGDPAENAECIAQLRTLLGQVPIFGICLGHQLLALASGYTTYKLKYGHRGVNQPVCELATGRVYITSQNHGYAVDAASATAGAPAFENANDGTCEGLDYPALGAFSVQFHPEACSGPRDTMRLFDRFIARMLKGGAANAAESIHS